MSDLQENDRVVIHGLTGRKSRYNGTTGQLVRFAKKGCWYTHTTMYAPVSMRLRRGLRRPVNEHTYHNWCKANRWILELNRDRPLYNAFVKPENLRKI